MKTKTCIAAALVAGFLPLSGALAADGPLSVTIGLKAWNNGMGKWLPSATGEGADTTAIVASAESSNATAFIPSATVRYGDFLVGGSLFTKKNYNFGGDILERKEQDLIVGYYVLPTLSVIVGYKQIRQSFDLAGVIDPTRTVDIQTWKYKGPILGFAGSAPLGSGFSLYGTAAIGTLDFRPSGSLKDIQAVHDSRADYRLGEVGLAYSFGGAMGLKAVTATLGYRTQSIVVKLKGVWEGQKGRDATDGLALGIVAAF